jgi:hypothetical protein
VYERHDGIYMLHEQIETYWNQMKVAGTCRSELIRCEDAVWLVVPVDIGHDRMPWILCRRRSTV